ncbi:uncharacterized protein LOC107369276 [Tetranychus urticae]|uniref:PX domain-containing protein n=1 Tax=Tetranychus urticae TaxID=32264 RepID=T1L1G2_TETUR|nr:uncharacterized protein LOC107369276 [Tetranychus urticae]
MFVQLFNLLTVHYCFIFSVLFLLVIIISLLFCTFSTTLLILIAVLIYCGYKLSSWISSLNEKDPVAPYDWFDELAHRKAIGLINNALDLSNVEHCGQEISLENETFKISENLCADYIVPWCTTISPESSFPADAERAIFELIHAILRRLTVIDTIELFKDVLIWFQLMCLPETRDKLILSNEEMNVFLQVSSEKVLKSCSPTFSALIDGRDKSEGSNDPLVSMIYNLTSSAAIIPIFDLISDPEFLNQCIARLFSIKFRDDAPVKPEEIQNYLQNSPEPLLMPPKYLIDGTARSISVDAKLLKENNLDSPTELLGNRFKIHKRSLSQPGSIEQPEITEIVDMQLQSSQRPMDSLPCETGIDLDSLPNPSSRVFRNIRIDKWELVKKSRELYVVYIIDVDALYEEVHPEKIYKSTSEEDTREECIVSSLIWKKLTIKHRFREFVDLQVKLENHTRLRGTLRAMNKTVIKPSTLKLYLMSLNPLRSSVSNKGVIEHRRKCLEKYLNELSKFERISRSREFRDFLGYKEERSSFLRSPSQSILVPLGIDKVYRNVRDAITFLKPTNPTEGTFAPGPTLVISDSPLTCLKLTKISHNKPSKILKLINEPRFIQSLIQSIDTKKEISNSNNSVPDFSFLNLGKRSQGDGCDDSPEHSQCKQRSVKIPLVESLINIIQTIIPLSTTSWFTLILLTIKVYLGSTLERLLGALIMRICCTETFAYLLHTFHESIWEDDDKDELVKHELPSASHLVDQLVNMLRNKPLLNYVPITHLEQSVQSMFNTFQSKDHNKMFILLVLSSLLKRSQIY